jgi:hypothetical protein
MSAHPAFVLIATSKGDDPHFLDCGSMAAAVQGSLSLLTAIDEDEKRKIKDEGRRSALPSFVLHLSG